MDNPRWLKALGIFCAVQPMIISAAVTSTLREVENSYPFPAGADPDHCYSELVRESSGRMESGGASPDHCAATFRYDSVLLTIAAGIESRSYRRGGAWNTRRLPLPEAERKFRFYHRDPPAHIHIGSGSSDRLFIIFNSSYSTWERGTWTNKMTALIRNQFGDCHIVVFAGPLTPEFLQCHPDLPALGSDRPARDLYARLRALVADLKHEGRIPTHVRAGLVGFSGGANLVISLLARDAQMPAPMFLEGGLALSPLLDLSATCAVLDQANEKLNAEGFPKSAALTAPVFPDVVLALLKGYSAWNPVPYLRLSCANAAADRRRRAIRSRFYREFQAVDLRAVMRTSYVGVKSPAFPPDVGHLEYYEEHVFPLHRARYGLAPSVSFRDYTSLTSEVAAVRKAPLYLLFAQDDPVLAQSALTASEPSPECLRILRFAAEQPRIHLFSPDHGAHMGYMLHTSFMSALVASFFRD